MPVTRKQSRKEAISGPDRDKWLAAEQVDLDSLNSKGTWSLKPLPPGRKSIGTRWVYRRKTDADGNVIRHKARLVCQGFSQIPGIDFTHTYSPVEKNDDIMYRIGHCERPRHGLRAS